MKPQRPEGRTAAKAPAQSAISSVLKGAAAVVAWILVWQILAMAISNPWLLSTPVETACAWAALAATLDFWLAVLHSLARIALGFAIAFICGITLGYLAAKVSALRIFLKPAVLAVKSAPVVCIIALLLVAAGSSATTSIVVGLVVFPPFYHAILESSTSQDGNTEKVLDAFGVPFMRRALCVDLVTFASSIRAAMSTAAGLAWKSGVAAELIGLPGISIGEGVFLAKISLDSASIIAWTATVILLSWASEKLLLALTDAATRLPARWLSLQVKRALSTPPTGSPIPERHEAAPEADACSITIDEAERVFCHDGSSEERLRYEHIHVVPGARLCIMAPSGSGKTTLLHLICGIEPPDTGKVTLASQAEDAHSNTRSPSVSLMLQEATLLPWASALENVALVARDASEVRRAKSMLERVLDDEDLDKPARSLSGGMRRRAELCRALAHASSAVVLDEPFSGIDSSMKQRCISMIDEELNGRTLIVATHDETDACALKAECLRLQPQAF